MDIRKLQGLNSTVALLLEAIAAKYWASAGRLERHFGLLAALGTGYGEHLLGAARSTIAAESAATAAACASAAPTTTTKGTAAAALPATLATVTAKTTAAAATRLLLANRCRRQEVGAFAISADLRGLFASIPACLAALGFMDKPLGSKHFLLFRCKNILCCAIHTYHGLVLVRHTYSAS
jgi:hypothetical protein